jgi:hypothetical protein
MAFNGITPERLAERAAELLDAAHRPADAA